MIVALLILIVFILLFGAGVVKGWIANAAGVGCGFVIFAGLVIWIGSFFGEKGPEYVIWTILGLMMLIALWAGATGEGTRK